MAKENKEEKLPKKIKVRLQKENVIAEAYFTALFFNNPTLYALYPPEKINTKTFQNKEWGFYFGLGRSLFVEKGIKVFDDISVYKHVKELDLEEKYTSYGGFETVQEVAMEVTDMEENIDSYYDEIKKYSMIEKLVSLFGEKVLTPNGKYDYKFMSRDVLHGYWTDKLNNVGLDADNVHEEHDLLAGLRESIQNWDKNPSIGLPYYKSPKLTKITTGWDFGNLYINGGFGGSGKTSFSFNKVVMSCISLQEKLAIIANEQGIEEFRKMLIITAMGLLNKTFDRQRINEGSFTEDEHDKMEKAVQWVEKISNQDDSIIKLIFMEDYIMEDVKKIIKRVANRGYRSIMIDTAKPSEGDVVAMARWERFTEDFKELYKLCRPNGGGLNLRMWANVQLADTALKNRFLDEFALGDSKKIKNEASCVFMMRTVWDDEHKDGDNELTVTNWVHDPDHPFANDKGLVKNKFALEVSDNYKYYLIFTPKNRRGKDNKQGLDVLVMKVNLNSNTWWEVGWTHVTNDKSF